MSNPELNIINMADVEAVAVKWLWKPYIPLGKITIIQGDPGEGKTTLALSIAAALTQGEKLSNEAESQAPMNVIYQTAEDGLADTIKPRLEAVNADCTKVLVIDESKEELSMTDERIEKAIQQTGAKLIILDPIQAYIGANVDMHRANEIRPVMSKLGRIAEEYGCAVVLIGHMNKAAGQKSSYRGLGSIDITAVARSVLIVGKMRDSPSKRIMTQAKSSLAPVGKSLLFEINENSALEWKGEVDITAEQFLENGGAELSKLEIATEFLLETLKDGKVSQKEIAAAASDYDFSARTLNEAKKNLKVLSIKADNKWYWKLPD